MREAIGGAVIENRKLLVVLKKESWILPGGKPQEGESDLACLTREFREELSGTRVDVKNAHLYGIFEGISPNKGTSVRVKVYRTDLSSNLGEASAEIKDRKFLDYSSLREYPLSSITQGIVEKLHSDRLI